MKAKLFEISMSILICSAGALPELKAADETINGNLTVEGSLTTQDEAIFGGDIDVQGNTISYGIRADSATTPGVVQEYEEVEISSVFSIAHIRSIATRDAVRWSWGTLSEEMMALSSSGLKLFNQEAADGDSALTLGLGDGRYLRSGSSVLTYGPGSTALNANSIALGSNAWAKASPGGTIASVAIGSGAISGYTGAEAGLTNVTSVGTWNGGEGGVAIGHLAYAGVHAVALGTKAKARQGGSIAMGEAEAYGGSSVAMGTFAMSNDYAVSIGVNAGNNGYLASGVSSVSIGPAAKGWGYGAVAIGHYPIATGDYAIAMGNVTQVSQPYAIALGNWTMSNYRDQVSLGSFNDPGPGSGTASPSDPIFVIGNGTADNARSNALLVRRNGNAEVKGDLRVEGKITRIEPAGGISMGDYTYDPEEEP